MIVTRKITWNIKFTLSLALNRLRIIIIITIYVIAISRLSIFFLKHTKIPSPRKLKSKPSPLLLSPKLLLKPSSSIYSIISSRIFNKISGTTSSI
jgi:hypothetical protein